MCDSRKIENFSAWFVISVRDSHKAQPFPNHQENLTLYTYQFMYWKCLLWFQLKGLIEVRVLRGKGDPGDLLRAVFSGIIFKSYVL